VRGLAGDFPAGSLRSLHYREEFILPDRCLPENRRAMYFLSVTGIKNFIIFSANEDL